MNNLTHHIGARSLLRSAGLLLLMSILVFQFMAPSASAFPSTDHGHSQKADYRQSDCGMMIENVVHEPDGSSEHSGHQENAAHCMPSMCCFHDTIVSAKLDAIGLLLPSSRLIEPGIAYSSHSSSNEDRPPKRV
jgi:hypothetical protein